MVVGVDHHVDRAILRPFVEPVEAELRRIRKLAVDHHDAGGIIRYPIVPPRPVKKPTFRRIAVKTGVSGGGA